MIWCRAGLLALGVTIAACSDVGPEPTPVSAQRREQQARSTPRPWLERLLAKSNVVMRGRVRDVHGEPSGPTGEPGIHTRVRLDVVRTLAGRPATTVELWTPGGTVDQRARRLSLEARFAVGEEVLVFLVNRDGILHVAELGLGKWSLQSAGDDRFAPDPQVLAHLEATAARSLTLSARELEHRLSFRRAQ